MRKVLTNKKYIPRTDFSDFEKPSACQCLQTPSVIFPKNNRQCIISNNWAQRNDSSHINAILNPEIYQNSPHIRKTATTKVVKKCCLSTNTCYCREESITPKLKKNPKICFSVNDGNLTRKSLECLCYENEEPRIPRNVDELKTNGDMCDFENNYVRSRLPLSKTRKIIENTQGSDKANNVRLDDIQFTQEIPETELGEYLKNITTEYEQNEEQLVDEYENEDIKTILSTKHPETFSTNHVTESHFQGASSSFVTDDVQKFRNEHYFETHSTDRGALSDYARNVSNHKCIHQFRLDDRLLPEALKKDGFGRSLCSICDKPMDGSSVSLDKSYYRSDQPSKTSIKNFAKCYTYGFVPKTIYMSNTADNPKIEVKLSKEEFTKLDGLLSKMKRMKFCNTLALRQQRMSL